jgi:hypothetical protein
VGRYYGDNDFNAGVRDKLHYDYCEYDDDYNSHLLYTDKVFIIPPSDPPTYHCYWHWWEWSWCMKVCEVQDWVLAIKYVKVKRMDPPTWWPEGDPPQGAYDGHEDTYIGIMMDVDCPYDTMDGESARNPAGYDAVNHIAWMQGYDYTGAHPDYNNYYAGMALADPDGNTANYVPYASWCIKNHTYLYPQSPWGWLDEEFYDWAATAGQGVEDPDTLADRSQVMTALHLPAEVNATKTASFVLIEASTPNGLAALQAMIDTARAMVIRENANHDFPPPQYVCGDVAPGGVGDGLINVNDAIYLLNYLFRGDDPPMCPRGRGDTNADNVINVNDALVILGYCFRNGDPPDCP